MEIWLAAAICVLFVGEAAWRFVEMMKMPNGPDRASALFNGVNFLLFALIGGLCLLWPHISCWFKSGSSKDSMEKKSDGVEACKADADVVVVAVDSDDVKTSMGALEVESEPAKPAAGPSAAVAKPAKRQLVYLTNMKTFLTFIVVTHHTVNNFSIAALGGLATYAYDPANPYDGATVSSFMTGAIWFSGMNQNYFMAAFFLISAYFCPKSLDRKGFRAFVIDKLVRLGGPILLFSTLLGPLLTMWCSAYAGLPLTYTYSLGPPWFILWLLNFTLIYAVVAQVLPSLHFKMPHPLLLLVLGLGLGGVFYAISINIGEWISFANMVFWQFGLAIYVPFFVAGIAGGRNDWLRSVENMATWLVWCLRITVVGFWVLQFFNIAQYYPPGPLSSVHIGSLESISIPIYAVAMTLAEMQLFHQYFNSSPQSKFMKSAGLAAYTVYVIHPWVLSLFQLIFIEILKAANVSIAFSEERVEIIIYYMLDANGAPALLTNGYIWSGWVFVFVLTQLVVWPLAHYFRKLPVMNKMF